jgi:hypothetical protein
MTHLAMPLGADLFHDHARPRLDAPLAEVQRNRADRRRFVCREHIVAVLLRIVRRRQTQVCSPGAGRGRNVEQLVRAGKTLGEQPHNLAALGDAADVIRGRVVVDEVRAVLLDRAWVRARPLAELENIQLIRLVVRQVRENGP